MKNKDIPFVFFGTPERAVTTLDILSRHELIPQLIVTAPDRPRGRGMKLASSPVKVWADKHSIETLQPKKIDKSFRAELEKYTPQSGWDVFVVVAYGQIVPQWLINIPKNGMLNVHYSLLPLYRGASPTETQILHDDPMAGVTIIQIDEKMDHGPIVAQVVHELDEMPKNSELVEHLSDIGGNLLAGTLPEWVAGNIDPQEQDHTAATYCKKIQKEDAELDLGDNSREQYLKILAYDMWPRAYFFEKDGTRVIVTDAKYSNDTLTITRVIPEGKKEMSFKEYRKRS